MIDPQDLWLTEEQVKAHLARTQDGKRKPRSPRMRFKHKKAGWAAFPYNRLLELARANRDPLLVTLAELHRLQFRSWEKDEPFEFTNTVFRQLGFDRHAKIRALKTLESVGWISVKWRKRKSPLVKIVRGFYFGS